MYHELRKRGTGCPSARRMSVAKHPRFVDQGAERLEFLRSGRRNGFDLLCRFHFEASICPHVVDCDAWEYHRQPRFKRVRIKIEDALRRYDPFRPASVVVVLAAYFFSRMRDEVDFLDQAALVVRSEEHVGIAHAYRDVIDPDGARPAKG